MPQEDPCSGFQRQGIGDIIEGKKRVKAIEGAGTDTHTQDADGNNESVYTFHTMSVGVSSNHGQVLVFFMAALVLGACTRTYEEIPVTLPATPPLSRSVIGYGVMSNSYTHIQNEPSQGSVSLGYLRRGSVTEILERRSIINRGTPESWIRINGPYRGWIKEEGVLIYDNEAQAWTASESLHQ
jgi:hypothetical protein